MNVGASPDDPRAAFFDARAVDWDRCGPDPVEIERKLSACASRFPLGPGQRVLEVGCGTGRYTGWLLDRVRPGGSVVGIDFAPGMIAEARRRGLDATFREFDVCSDPVGDQEYDVAFCLGVFPHFREQRRALRNLASSVHPGGRLIVVHFSDSAGLNAFHASLSGAVSGDRLPHGSEWEGLVRGTGWLLDGATDEPGLFLALATRA